MGEFLKQKICSLKHPCLSTLLFLTSNPFTLAQDNSRWLEERLPQKFCGTSSSSKCSSSEEKGEVQKTSYSTPSRKKRSIIKGRQQCLWCRWLSAVDYCWWTSLWEKNLLKPWICRNYVCSGRPLSCKCLELRMFSEKNIYASSIATVFSKHLGLVTVRNRIRGNMNVCSNPLWLSTALKLS